MPASKAARCAPPARPAGSDSARGVFPIRYARRGGQLLVMLDCALKQNLNGFNKDHGIGADSRVPELPPFLVLKKRAVCSSKPASSIFFGRLSVLCRFTQSLRFAPNGPKSSCARCMKRLFSYKRRLTWQTCRQGAYFPGGMPRVISDPFRRRS